MSSEEPMELRLSGKDITHRPALPYPVGLTGIHEGASPPGDVVAAFFPQTLGVPENKGVPYFGILRIRILLFLGY